MDQLRKFKVIKIVSLKKHLRENFANNIRMFTIINFLQLKMGIKDLLDIRHKEVF